MCHMRHTKSVNPCDYWAEGCDAFLILSVTMRHKGVTSRINTGFHASHFFSPFYYTFHEKPYFTRVFSMLSLFCDWL